MEGSHFPDGGRGQFCKDLLNSAMLVNQSAPGVGEFGIGLNRSIVSVTGSSVLDEKVYGSAHIALGSNIPFGGTDEAPYHFDLVFYPVSILLDNVELDIGWKTQ